MSKQLSYFRFTLQLIFVIRDENDAQKKFKNSFILSDVIGKNHLEFQRKNYSDKFWQQKSHDSFRNYFSKDA